MKYLVYFMFFFGIILTYLLGRLALYHETRSEKRKNKLFWQKVDSFWWIISAPKVFSKDQSPITSISISTFPPTQQSLRSCRGDADVDLPYLSGVRADRNIAPLKTKWSLSISHRVTYLSESNYFKTFPSSDGSLSSSKIEEAPRPVPFVHDTKTKTSDQGDLRSGFHCTYPLWQTRDGSDRLQSQEVGSPFLSPPSLFQWDHKRFLAWRTPSWRYPYGYWDRGTSQSGLCQITFLCKDRNYPSRQGFLRSRDYRISGVPESLFCHCCQAYWSDQKNPIDLVISSPFFWSGEHRVHVSTHKVEKRISLCGGQASHPRRSFGTTHPLFNGQVQLSGCCNEHETDPSQYVEILQWQSCCRTDYQRTQRELSIRKNPNETFLSQRGLFPHALIFLQSHQLVQTTLSPNGVPKYDA